MAHPLGYPKTKKLSASGVTPRPGGLPLDPTEGFAPDPRALPQLQICHHTTAGQLRIIFIYYLLKFQEFCAKPSQIL